MLFAQMLVVATSVMIFLTFLVYIRYIIVRKTGITISRWQRCNGTHNQTSTDNYQTFFLHKVNGFVCRRALLLRDVRWLVLGALWLLAFSTRDVKPPRVQKRPRNQAAPTLRHSTTTTRMLWGYCLQYFVVCEELLVRDTNLHYKDCSEMHSGSCMRSSCKGPIALNEKFVLQNKTKKQGFWTSCQPPGGVFY